AFRRWVAAVCYDARLEHLQPLVRAPLPGGIRMSPEPTPSRPASLSDTGNLPRRQRIASIGRWVLLSATMLAVLALVVLLWYIFQRGWDWLSWGLLTNPPSRKPEKAGLGVAISGTLWIIS